MLDQNKYHKTYTLDMLSGNIVAFHVTVVPSGYRITVDATLAESQIIYLTGCERNVPNITVKAEYFINPAPNPVKRELFTECKWFSANDEHKQPVTGPLEPRVYNLIFGTVQMHMTRRRLEAIRALVESGEPYRIKDVIYA